MKKKYIFEFEWCKFELLTSVIQQNGILCVI